MSGQDSHSQQSVMKLELTRTKSAGESLGLQRKQACLEIWPVPL